MPKKTKDKKPKAEKVEVVEKTEWDEKTVEQIEEDKRLLLEQIQDSRSKRNYFEQERDMIQNFYDVVHQDVVETQAKIRNTESEMERMQDAHRNDIRIYVQKVKHLEYEHKNNLAAVAQEGAKLRESETEAHQDRKSSLQTAKSDLRAELRRLEEQQQDELASAKELQSKELVTLRLDFDHSMRELQAKYDQRLEELKQDLELRRKMEIHEIEERKNLHINKLISNHEKAFREIKDYYYDITKDNLDLIKSLNEEYAELKAQEQRTGKKMSEIEAQNKTLSKPLAEASAAVAELKHKLQHYEKDKNSLRHLKARLLVEEERFRSLQSEHDALQRRFASVQSEREMLHQTFEATLQWVQQRNADKQARLHERFDEVQNRVEEKNVQLSEIMRAAQLDEVVLRNVTNKLDSVLSGKNQQVKQLKYDIARVQKAHDDLIRTYEARLVELGIPEDERHILMPRTNLTTAPAGLI